MKRAIVVALLSLSLVTPAVAGTTVVPLVCSSTVTGELVDPTIHDVEQDLGAIRINSGTVITHIPGGPPVFAHFPFCVVRFVTPWPVKPHCTASGAEVSQITRSFLTLQGAFYDGSRASWICVGVGADPTE
jgi:hypothetical protein